MQEQAPNHLKLRWLRAKVEGVKDPSGVRGMIIRVSDQLRCGEISLFEVDQEAAEAAKARLEAKRAQRRERHAKNKYRINAKRREKCVLKKTYRGGRLIGDHKCI